MKFDAFVTVVYNKKCNLNEYNINLSLMKYPLFHIFENP